jgi:hypothetical protein
MIKTVPMKRVIIIGDGDVEYRLAKEIHGLGATGSTFYVRRVSTTLRHMLMGFSEFFHVSWTGLLIHASVGTAGGLGALRTKRSG